MSRKTEVTEMSVLPSTEKVLQNAGPFGYQLGLGSIAGYAAGVAGRTAVTLGIALAGGAFITLQGLQYYGYISVDWRKVERELTAFLYSDSDGKLTAKDVQSYWQKTTDVLAFGVPGGAGFSLGLACGVGGRMAKLLAGGTVIAVTTTTSLYDNADNVAAAVARALPAAGKELRHRLIPDGGSGGGGGISGGLAGDAAWRLSLLAARSDVGRLRELEREVRAARALWRRAKPEGGGLDSATARARLSEIEERKKAVKAAAAEKKG